jgi:hypothetical protein
MKPDAEMQEVDEPTQIKKKHIMEKQNKLL